MLGTLPGSGSGRKNINVEYWKVVIATWREKFEAKSNARANINNNKTISQEVPSRHATFKSGTVVSLESADGKT